MLESARNGGDMEFYYLSKYPIRLCREYMTHFNIYDRFEYTWEGKGDCYLITFKEFRNSMLSLSGVRRPIFKVVFEDFGDQTGIRVQNINPNWIVKTPTVSIKEIDKFWEKKLDAKRIKNDREKHTVDSIISKLIKKRT